MYFMYLLLFKELIAEKFNGKLTLIEKPVNKLWRSWNQNMLTWLLQLYPLSIKRIRWNILATNLPWWCPKLIMENLSFGLQSCIFNWSKIVDQMGKVSKEHDLKNYQEIAQEGCMPFCYYLRSLIFKMVLNLRSRTTWEATWGQ